MSHSWNSRMAKITCKNCEFFNPWKIPNHTVFCMPSLLSSDHYPLCNGHTTLCHNDHSHFYCVCTSCILVILIVVALEIMFMVPSPQLISTVLEHVEFSMEAGHLIEWNCFHTFGTIFKSRLMIFIEWGKIFVGQGAVAHLASPIS